MSNGGGDLGELLMLVGDLHVPQRALDLPQCFRDLLNTDKIKQVLCTGNVGSQQMKDLLLGISPNLHMVKGDFDQDTTLPEELIIHVGNFKIGLINGYQLPSWGDKNAVYEYAKNRDVDVLVYGHTHISDVSKISGKILVNPGSATGAFQPWAPNAIPTFMLMAVQGSKIVIYVYEEHEGQANVVMSEVDQDQDDVTPSNAQMSGNALLASKKATF
ncbi:putative vacuolar protein sorting protein 29 [Babesia bovis T2Bo]|uniref:Vacuolar protein sorting-associated protein 29 n=1 Tax=Babesia bovis TaxID=5865 RepID=A7APH0_BABBO|nr:putative vacuolar protein sorting protein 29 [Babesia bovis T2Bo]EDO08454.1 putative vacuolar protein sorting protein 29 [Babesia bovis T2Bo]|eukprot:XP_001612022.1 vacuolar protein sorting 29 [Babesia bovis T2Bo]